MLLVKVLAGFQILIQGDIYSGVCCIFYHISLGKLSRVAFFCFICIGLKIMIQEARL